MFPSILNSFKWFEGGKIQVVCEGLSNNKFGFGEGFVKMPCENDHDFLTIREPELKG